MGKRKRQKPSQAINHKPPQQAKTAILSVPHGGLVLVLAIFVTFACLYSLMVPLTQGEDELAHYRYLSFIAQTGRLPINFEEREQAWYRADWPPLYHLLVGWLVSPLDTTQPHLKDVGEAPRRRLVGEIFYPRLIIYTEDANWPWQDGILAWHLGRFASILFSAGALVLTYLTGLELFPGAGRRGSVVSLTGTKGHKQKLPRFPASPLRRFGPKSLAIAVTALLAFTPRYLFTSAMLGDDSLFILLSAAFIWLLLRALRGQDQGWLYGLIGLILGLSIATKYSTGLLPLAVIPVALWRAKQLNWAWRQWFGRVALSWAATLAGASWWFGWIGYHFNTIKTDGLVVGLLTPLLNSGPDVSMRRIFAFFRGGEFTGQERPDAIAAGSFWEWLGYLFQTYWGVPVLEHDPLFPWAYVVMLLVCLAALGGLWQLWQIADKPMQATLAILSFVVFLLLPFPILRFFLTRNVLETGQGRHILYPAAQSIPILLVLGWAMFSQRMANGEWRIRRRGGGASLHLQAQGRAKTTTPYVSRFMYFIPILLFVWSIFQYAYMSTTYPDPLPVQTTTFNPASIPQPVIPQAFGDGIELLGYDFQPDPELAIVNLTLFWKALKPVGENYRVQVELVDSGNKPHFVWLSHPLDGRYPTRAWDVGDVIRDELALPLAAVPADTYNLQINVLRQAEATPLLDEPYWLIRMPLGKRQPIAQASNLGDFEYRLWRGQGTARYRQTLPLSWQGDASQRPDWSLLGPDDVLRLPAARSDNTDIFIVGADWPSGDYRLQVQSGASSFQSEPLLTVANDVRVFDLPQQEEDYTSVEANFANQVKLLGYVLPQRRVEPGSGLPVTLYWQSLAPVLSEYVIFDVLLDKNQRPFGGYDRLPREYYSTILWAEDEVVEDGFAVPVRPDAPSGIYDLHIGLYSLETSQPVSLPLIQDGQAIEATSVVIGPIKVGGPPPEVVTDSPSPQVSLNQSFGGQITLLGYDLTDALGQPLSHPTNLQSPLTTLKITLYWRADSELQLDYTTFLHIRDQTDQLVTQKDNPPTGGLYPTSLWDVGEIIVDEIIVPLEDIPLGQYTPVVGLYDFVSQTRLPTEGLPENEVRLESVTLP